MRYLVPFVVGVLLASATLPLAAKPEPPQPTLVLSTPGLAPTAQTSGEVGGSVTEP